MQCPNIQHDAGKTVWKGQALEVCVCGSWEVKATDRQAGYCVKQQALCCRKQNGKRVSDD